MIPGGRWYPEVSLKTCRALVLSKEVKLLYRTMEMRFGIEIYRLKGYNIYDK
jgi:hypothetical protein